MPERRGMKENRKSKGLISGQMLLFEFRNTIGNPYVHIFGVGMPVLMMIIITRAVAGESAGGSPCSRLQ